MRNTPISKTPIALLVRVSTNQQETLRQINDLKKVAEQQDWNIIEIVETKESGMKRREDLAGLRRIEELAKSNKIEKVLVTEISRIARRSATVHSFVETLEECGVSLYWQSQNMETLQDGGKRNPAAALVLSLMAEMARAERDTTVERIHSGIAAAKAKGIHCGRPKGSSMSHEELLLKYPRAVSRLKKGTSVRDVMKLEGIANATVQRIRQALGLSKMKTA